MGQQFANFRELLIWLYIILLRGCVEKTQAILKKIASALDRVG